MGHTGGHALEVGNSGMAEMLLALEDSHHGGHLALETLDLDTNLRQWVKLKFPNG